MLVRVTIDNVPTVETFYEKYRPLVNSLLIKLGCREEELDDFFQDVILRIIETNFLEKYGQVDKGEYCASFKYYIYRIVRSVYLNKKRAGFKRELLGFKGRKKVWSEYKQIDPLSLDEIPNFEQDNSGFKEINIPAKESVEDKDLSIILDQFKSELDSQHITSDLTQLALWQYVYEGYTLVEVARIHNLKNTFIYGHYNTLRKKFHNFINKKGLNATLLLGR